METDVAYGDAGIVLGSVAGMLNILVMLDAFTWSEKKLLPQEKEPVRRGARTSAPAPGSSASPPPETQQSS